MKGYEIVQLDTLESLELACCDAPNKENQQDDIIFSDFQLASETKQSAQKIQRRFEKIRLLQTTKFSSNSKALAKIHAADVFVLHDLFGGPAHQHFAVMQDIGAIYDL